MAFLCVDLFIFSFSTNISISFFGNVRKCNLSYYKRYSWVNEKKYEKRDNLIVLTRFRSKLLQAAWGRQKCECIKDQEELSLKNEAMASQQRNLWNENKTREIVLYTVSIRGAIKSNSMLNI